MTKQSKPDELRVASEAYASEHLGSLYSGQTAKEAFEAGARWAMSRALAICAAESKIYCDCAEEIRDLMPKKETE